ncbi:gluconokinase [Pedobacter aquatilis]|uniref:gluconokinase n=1 Tax=Pedobacter aquatilis TaxID=351343 RepID=UPI0025B3F56A|nr:gluconokinase [Pedobacter aquatilis]MDN3585938.1 gluconokinase [Pedobacter aquatilis]
MKYIIGIDIGTGSTKAVALNLNYEPISTSQHHYPTHSSKPGYSEQDPEVIWQAFLKCIADLKTELGAEPITIGLSSAMHSLILVNAEGLPLAPMLTWADNRSATIAERLLSSEIGLKLYAETGTPIHPMSPLCKIIWLKENAPALFAQTDKFISIKEYIWFKLFGEYVVDYSIASCTGLFDIDTLKWNNKALELCNISTANLSEPVSTSYSSSKITQIHQHLLKSENLSFVIGASDGCLANLGSEAIFEGSAALTIGTSGALRVASTKPIVNKKAMTFNYILDRETFICGGPINNGGLALQWLMKNVFGKNELNEADYIHLFEEMEKTDIGSNGLIFLPYLTGERAPIWNSKASGVFIGLSNQHHQKHMARAVIEGICFSLNDVLTEMEANGANIQKIHASGGFVHSQTWMQILADVTGKEILLITEEDASAVGAAYLAAKTTGIVDYYPSKKKTFDMINPNPANHIFYKQRFTIYKKAYLNLKECMQEINQP